MDQRPDHPVVVRVLAALGRDTPAPGRMVEADGCRIERARDGSVTAWVRLSAEVSFGLSPDGAWVVARGRLPGAVAGAIPGRAARQVVDHPHLEGLVVASVEERANGFRLLLAD